MRYASPAPMKLSFALVSLVAAGLVAWGSGCASDGDTNMRPTPDGLGSLDAPGPDGRPGGLAALPDA